ncbi:hypothetical protein HMP0721_1618 [Pseudoramibacter alactolyticus ATCC 23263]|uniref:Uncharacterized protein n=1 Tax=Pseudoramibacter alactolyticus ATCC 23263 TaxID=887929 RepID=E6MI85_9FIRM|nr:hypothetical protein HMP0721_1618 [Pseudoramibacter alactolyticus ATCC 23263]
MPIIILKIPATIFIAYTFLLLPVLYFTNCNIRQSDLFHFLHL